MNSYAMRALHKHTLDFSKLLFNKKSDSVFIVAGGYSLHDFDFSKLLNVDTIAINASAEYIDNPTYFITMDYYFCTKKVIDINALTESGTGTFFIVNMATDKVYKDQVGRYVNKKTLAYRELYDFKHIVESNSLINDITGFSETMPDFSHGQNSGFCAIQLAILLKYQKIYLLGFDMHVKNQHTHFHDKYSVNNGFRPIDEKIDKYRETLKKAIQLYEGPSQIISCNSTSALNDVIQYVHIDKALKIIS